MEKFIIENLGLLIAVFFLIGLVLIQRWKIKYLERLVVNSDDLKSRAEFETKESQAGAYFQEKVIGELLKEFSDEELMAIEDRMARHIRRISNMEIQDGDMLKEVISRFVEELKTTGLKEYVEKIDFETL